MSMLRDYTAITNSRYRLVCNLVIPVGIGALTMILTFIIGSWSGALIAHCIGALCLVSFEVTEDYFGFGAICVKGCLGMDYLKTSPRGKKMICNALLADILVRPVRIAVCLLLIGIAYGVLAGNPVRPLLMSILLAANISVWGLNITRYMQNIQVIILVATLVAAAAGAGIVYFGYMMERADLVWLTAVGFVVLLILGIYVTYRHMYHKVEMSYMDGGIKK